MGYLKTNQKSRKQRTAKIVLVIVGFTTLTSTFVFQSGIFANDLRTLFKFGTIANMETGNFQTTSDSVLVTQLIIDDYKTLENWNIKKHIENCTVDYILIENGDIQTLSDEIEFYKMNAKRVITRTDSFQFLKVKVYENTAYLVYRLKSDIREQEKLKTYTWTESAICRREHNKWKIALINSTPAKF